MRSLPDDALPVPIPLPVRTTLRGIGQVFFQENAYSGLLFLLGIAAGSLPMAAGALAGAIIGPLTAHLLKFDRSELAAGIFGFNATLVGIATLFFFQPGALSVVMLIVGCVAATVVTHLMRRHLPFPTYTTPFILVTWVLFFLGQALGVPRVVAGDPVTASLVGSVAHGIGQVMFQATLATGLLFLAGIAISNWHHAAWVLAGSILGMLVGSYHATGAARALDPERLIERALTENVALGLYGYNATLAAVALFLWRRSLIPPLLGILLSVPLTEFVPRLGLPALTAPFVLATWIVIAIAWIDRNYLRASDPPAT